MNSRCGCPNIVWALQAYMIYWKIQNPISIHQKKEKNLSGKRKGNKKSKYKKKSRKEQRRGS